MSSVTSEALEGEVITTDLSALAVMVKAEIDSNVATAKQYPRSITAFRKEMLEFVTLSESVAEACIFALPRGKEKNPATGKWEAKCVEGPSVRFSEMLISAYGNCRSGAKIIGEERDFVIAEGFFHDLEKNVAVKCEIKRRITGKSGRYNADMIGVTGNAASSIARRNAALQGIPKALWQEMYDAAKRTAIGDAKTLVSKRSDMMAYFQKMNVVPETIFEFMCVEGIDDIGLDELAILKGIATAIKEGATTVDKAFAVDTDTHKQNIVNTFTGAKPEDANTTPVGASETSPQADGDILQECYKAVTALAEKTGDTPDDTLSELTKGKLTVLIDLEAKSTAYVNDIMMLVQAELNK